MADIEDCLDCERPFYVNEVGAQMPATSRAEAISCPHCGFTSYRPTRGLFKTSRLSAERERDYLARRDRLEETAPAVIYFGETPDSGHQRGAGSA